MNGGVSKAQARRSRVKLSKVLQETLLDALADTGAEIPRSHRAQPTADEFLARDATPIQATKRRLDETSESNPPPAKRARLARAGAQPPGVEEEKAEQGSKPTLQQPTPQSPKHPFVSFLEDFVDPVHPPAESVHTSVSKWLDSIGSDRKTRCRSDTCLPSGNSFISRDLTRSAPEMGDNWDTDGFMVPPIPASTRSRSYAADTDARSIAPSDATGSNRSGRSLVEDPRYRDMNLAANNISMRHPCDPIPEHITSLVDYVRRDREPEVEKYFHAHIFPDPKSSDNLKRSDREPMAKHTVPSAQSRLKVSTPVPDMLYGYNRQTAFPKQQSQLISMGTEMVATNQYHSLLYPFFVVEFKGDGGSMWVATNQCLGGSTSCVNIAENLNRQLRESRSDEVRPVDSAAFSIAMNGSEARLYISWKHDELNYCMANVRSFLLQDPEHYIQFRKCVLNIIDWGEDRRLNEIRDSLDSLLEESRKRASEEAKSRLPPSGSSATGKGKKHKPSSSRKNSSRSNSVQDKQ
ncbi:hypothetical protein OQA88_13194 [Cercophora sp. LCS_1]